ncbi:hypothetical protein AB0C91_10230 [Streptomyces sp. NPDC048674]|uniref:hypothetical protein n=1 Tax=Streptomyces sp. NPDC048674 TaxID=3155491 RepID=UPI0034428EBE
MSSARHFFVRGTISDATLKADIQADVTNSRNAQIDMQQAGQQRLAQEMRNAADEALDELNDLQSGTWKPRHA